MLRVTLFIIILAIAYLSLTPKYTITIGNDKISHFIAYGTLTINAGLLTIKNPKSFRSAIALCIVYGGLIEVGQYYVPGRFMSFYDIVANTAGVAIGTVVVLLFHKPILRILKRTKIIR